MKRRIDDLGRVLIPKEIRKMLFLEEDDHVEFVLENGRVFIRKHSYFTDFTELSSYLQDLTETIHEVCGHFVIITDKDKIIAATGASMRLANWLQQPIPNNIKKALKTTLPTQLYDENLIDTQNFKSIATYPICRDKDLIGTIIIASKNEAIEEKDMTLLSEAANQITKQLSIHTSSRF